MIYPLIDQLEGYGADVYFEVDQVQIELPWSPENAPQAVKTLLKEFKSCREELSAFFLQHIREAEKLFSPCVHMKDVYGLPESRSENDWKSRYDKAIREAFRRLSRGKHQEFNCLYGDAVYLSCCYRCLQFKGDGVNPFKHIVENMLKAGDSR